MCDTGVTSGWQCLRKSLATSRGGIARTHLKLPSLAKLSVLLVIGDMIDDDHASTT